METARGEMLRLAPHGRFTLRELVCKMQKQLGGVCSAPENVWDYQVDSEAILDMQETTGST